MASRTFCDICGEKFTMDTGSQFGAKVTIAYPRFAHDMPADEIQKDVCAQCINQKKVTLFEVGGECPWYIT